MTKEEEVGGVRYINHRYDSDSSAADNDNISYKYFPLLDVGLHEGRALFATFSSLNPLTRPSPLAKTGTWCGFTQSCSLYPRITIKKGRKKNRVLRGSQA